MELKIYMACVKTIWLKTLPDEAEKDSPLKAPRSSIMWYRADTIKEILEMRFFWLVAALIVPLFAAAQPSPESLKGLPVVGRLDARSGQVIEGVHVTTAHGPCIQINQGVHDVTIRNSEIGPCGTSGVQEHGVFILEGVSNVTVANNIIHDVASGVYAYRSATPLSIHHNFFYDIRGPYPAGSAIKLQEMVSDGGPTRITCNVSDVSYGSGVKWFEDHISVIKSAGTRESPIEVAWNRIRGGTSKIGSGIMVGDGGGSWIYVHDNVVVKAANVGIGVAGGSHILLAGNKVDNRGEDRSSQTYHAYSVRGLSRCSDVALRGNRGIARLWNWAEGNGKIVSDYQRGSGKENCEGTIEEANNFGDETLSPAIFSEVPSACR